MPLENLQYTRKFLKQGILYISGFLAFLVIMYGSYILSRNLGFFEPSQHIQQVQSLNRELLHYKVASKITDYYYRFNKPVRVKVVHDILDALEIYLPKYFPDGPYTTKDLLAMAMVESNFDQYLTGGDGEYGIFQILPASSRWMGVSKNQFNINVNTELALFVLKKKYEKHRDYKIALIAYNGIVKRNNQINEDYWDKFVQYRRALDDILREYSQLQ